jgi:hypothetical protein
VNEGAPLCVALRQVVGAASLRNTARLDESVRHTCQPFGDGVLGPRLGELRNEYPVVIIPTAKTLRAAERVT